MKTLLAWRVHPKFSDEVVGSAVLHDGQKSSLLIDVFDAPLSLAPIAGETALLRALTEDGTAVGTVRLTADHTGGSFDLGWMHGRLTPAA